MWSAPEISFCKNKSTHFPHSSQPFQTWSETPSPRPSHQSFSNKSEVFNQRQATSIKSLQNNNLKQTKTCSGMTDQLLDDLNKTIFDTTNRIDRDLTKMSIRPTFNSRQMESPTDVQNAASLVTNQDIAKGLHSPADIVENQGISSSPAPRRWQKTRKWVFLCVKKVPCPNCETLCYNWTKTSDKWLHFWPAYNL